MKRGIVLLVCCLWACTPESTPVRIEGETKGPAMQKAHSVVQWSRRLSGTREAIFPIGPPAAYGPSPVALEDTWWRSSSGAGTAGALHTSRAGLPPQRVAQVSDSGAVDVGQDPYGLMRRGPTRIERTLAGWRSAAAAPTNDDTLATAVAAEIEALSDAEAFGGDFDRRSVGVQVATGTGQTRREFVAWVDYESFGKPARLDLQGVVELSLESGAPLRFVAHGAWTAPMFNLRGDYEMHGTFQYEASWAYGHDLPRATTP